MSIKLYIKPVIGPLWWLMAVMFFMTSLAPIAVLAPFSQTSVIGFMGLFWFGMAIGLLRHNTLWQRYSGRFMPVAILLSLIFASLAVAISYNLWVFGFARFLQGLCLALLLGRWQWSLWPRFEYITHSWQVWLGGVVMVILAAVLTSAGTFIEVVWGWRYNFIVFAAVSLLIGLFGIYSHRSISDTDIRDNTSDIGSVRYFTIPFGLFFVASFLVGLLIVQSIFFWQSAIGMSVWASLGCLLAIAVSLIGGILLYRFLGRQLDKTLSKILMLTGIMMAAIMILLAALMVGVSVFIQLFPIILASVFLVILMLDYGYELSYAWTHWGQGLRGYFLFFVFCAQGFAWLIAAVIPLFSPVALSMSLIVGVVLLSWALLREFWLTPITSVSQSKV